MGTTSQAKSAVPDSFLRKCREGDELEFRLGHFNEHRFENGITSYMYKVAKGIFRKQKPVVVEQTVYLYASGNDQVREIVTHSPTTGAVVAREINKKMPREKLDFRDLGIRVALSTEENLTRLPEKAWKKISKKRDRSSYTLSPDFRLDITKDIMMDVPNAQPHYQIEGEFVRCPASEVAEKWFRTMSSVKFMLDDAQRTCNDVVAFSRRPRIAPNEFYRVMMPRNLKSWYIPYLEDYALSTKPDGETVHVIVKDNTLKLINKTTFAVYIYADYDFSAYNNSIFLGEEMDDGSMILYDTLRHKNTDVRSQSLPRRYAFLDAFVASVGRVDARKVQKFLQKRTSEQVHLGQLSVAPIYTKAGLPDEGRGTATTSSVRTVGSLENRLRAVLAENNTTMADRNDGVLLRPLFEPHDNNNVWKWKPAHMNTIDFELVELADGKYDLLVAGHGGQKVSFPGTSSHPFATQSEMTLAAVPELARFGDPAHRIIEFRFDLPRGVFIPVRYRKDKVIPNFISVAEDIWADIYSPLSSEFFERLARTCLLPTDSDAVVVQKICSFLKQTCDVRVFEKLTNEPVKTAFDEMIRMVYRTEANVARLSDDVRCFVTQYAQLTQLPPPQRQS